jgi:hypothetical protein
MNMLQEWTSKYPKTLDAAQNLLETYKTPTNARSIQNNSQDTTATNTNSNVGNSNEKHVPSDVWSNTASTVSTMTFAQGSGQPNNGINSPWYVIDAMRLLAVPEFC